MTTKIEWCDVTWNPVTGCSPISEGCQRCYAKRMAERLRGRFGYPKHNPFQPNIWHADKFNDPTNWKKPRRIFVCSMGDLFHDEVEYRHINRIYRRTWNFRYHIYIFLTKRPKRLRRFTTGNGRSD